MRNKITLSLLSSLLLSTSMFAEETVTPTIASSDVEAIYAGKSTVNASKELTQSINIGFANTSGNTKTLNLNGKYLMSFTTVGLQDNALKVSFDASAFLTKNDDVTNNEEYTANLGLEQYLDDLWLGYASANWLQNEFRNFDNKMSVGAGVGVDIYQDSHQSLTAKIGLAYNIEQYSNADAERKYTSFNQYLEYNNVLNNTSTLYLKVGGAENIDDFQDYELLAVAGLNVSIAENLSLSIEEEVRYDKTPPTNSDDTDTKTIVRLGYNF